MRKVVAAVLFAIAGAALLLSGVAIATLFDDYKDSPDSLYIGTAAVTFTAAAVAAGVGAFLLRKLP